MRDPPSSRKPGSNPSVQSTQASIVNFCGSSSGIVLELKRPYVISTKPLSDPLSDFKLNPWSTLPAENNPPFDIP